MTRTRDAAPPTGDLTAIYARISEADEDDAAATIRLRTDGVDRQVADGTALCDRNGWAHLPPFVDNDYSASDYATKARPAYRRMMAMVRAGEITRIVCWDIDRLYRRVKELEELIELASTGRLSIVSMHGDLDLSSADGRFTARILVSMAQKSSDDTSRRIRRQRQADRDKGIARGGRVAFGWKDPMTPDPAEAKLIVEAMHALLAGESLVGIAKDWNRRGVPTKVSAKYWTFATVQQILTNPRNIAKVTHGYETEEGRRKWRRRQIVGDAQWPAIVDRATYEAVIATIDGRAAHLTGIPHAQAPLTYVMVCGHCGNSLTQGRNNGQTSWRCYRRPGVGCNRISVKAERLEPRVYEALFLYVDKMKLAELVDDADIADAQTDIIGQITALERKEVEYEDMLDADELDRRGFNRLRQRLLAEKAALTSRLARFERHVLAPYAGQPGRLRQAWDDLSVDRQRAIIAAALGPIVVRPTERRRFFDPDRVRFRGDLTFDDLLAGAA
jgi:DNA invertase Pin-like site-specific DNA recombinase